MKKTSILWLVLASLICSLLFLSSCVLLTGCGEQKSTKHRTAAEDKPGTKQTPKKTPKPKEEPAAAPQPTEPAAPPTPAEPLPSMGEKNALNKAKEYLNLMAFSYTGLVEQLEYEQFSHEEAVYAADRCGADWNKQAAKKAQKYLDLMSFSRSGLLDQLIYEGFTREQAEYGVQAVGY